MASLCNLLAQGDMERIVELARTAAAAAGVL